MVKPTGSSHIPLSVGGLCVMGGMYAYYKASSLPSLLGGVGTGSLLWASVYLINTGREYQGHLLASASSLILVGVGLTRYMKLRSMYPTGWMAIVGGLSLVYNFTKALEWKP